jgi:hypothetical protein
MKELSLAFIWKIRMSCIEEGSKLWTAGNELRAKGNRLRAEGDMLRADQLWAEGDKLWAEGDRICSEGDRVWEAAVIEVYGKNIKMEWKNWNIEKHSYECHLETGEVFKP